jgi:hypothetical protein
MQLDATKENAKKVQRKLQHLVDDANGIQSMIKFSPREPFFLEPLSMDEKVRVELVHAIRQLGRLGGCHQPSKFQLDRAPYVRSREFGRRVGAESFLVAPQRCRTSLRNCRAHCQLAAAQGLRGGWRPARSAVQSLRGVPSC